MEKNVQEAVEIAFQYGLIDGAHHKMWVIDQMLRKLLGKQYEIIVKAFQEPDDDDDYWDVGTPP